MTFPHLYPVILNKIFLNFGSLVPLKPQKIYSGTIFNTESLLSFINFHLSY